MQVKIEIETEDKTLVSDLFGSHAVLRGVSTKKVTDGVSIRFNGIVLREAIAIPDLIKITLLITEKVALPVAVGLFSSWLYDRLKNRRVRRISIERTEVKLDKGEIERILLEKIKENG